MRRPSVNVDTQTDSRARHTTEGTCGSEKIRCDGDQELLGGWHRPASLSAGGLSAAGCHGGGFFCGSGAAAAGATRTWRASPRWRTCRRRPRRRQQHLRNEPLCDRARQNVLFRHPLLGAVNVARLPQPTMPFGRTAAGQSAGVACISCHDAGHGGVDPASTPATSRSAPAGRTTIRSQHSIRRFTICTFGTAAPIRCGRRRCADNENALTTNGNRLQTAWLINDLYGAAYQACSPTTIPFDGPSSAVQALVDATGQCTPVGAPPRRLPAGDLDGDTAPTAAGRGFRCRASRGRSPAVSRASPASRSATRWTAWRRRIRSPSRGSWSTSARPSPPTRGRWSWAPRRSIVGRRSAGGQRRRVDGDSDQAKAGAQLFVGKAGCSDCHNTPLFSDGQFHNVGVGQIGAGRAHGRRLPRRRRLRLCAGQQRSPERAEELSPLRGARDGIQKLQANGFRRDSVWSDDPTDSRAARLTSPAESEHDSRSARTARPACATSR